MLLVADFMRLSWSASIRYGASYVWQRLKQPDGGAYKVHASAHYDTFITSISIRWMWLFHHFICVRSAKKNSIENNAAGVFMARMDTRFQFYFRLFLMLSLSLPLSSIPCCYFHRASSHPHMYHMSECVVISFYYIYLINGSLGFCFDTP